MNDTDTTTEGVPMPDPHAGPFAPDDKDAPEGTSFHDELANTDKDNHTSSESSSVWNDVPKRRAS